MTKQSAISSRAKALLNKPYARRLTPDAAGGFTASISEFPGCFAEGETAEEAIVNLQGAAESWLQVALSLGQDIREPVDFGGFSGKVALRIPRSLHKQVAELAALEGTSINQVFVSAISHYVGSKQILNDLSKALSTIRTNQLNVYIANAPQFTGATSSHDSTMHLERQRAFSSILPPVVGQFAETAHG